MTSYVENETGVEFPFSIEDIVNQIMTEVLDREGCPYEATVSVLLTDNEGIRTFNKEYRGFDKETDVLSFPNVDYETPSDFAILEETADCFDPDSGELVLGDIIISVEKVKEQAESYGHSQRREFAFLVAHSMFHLCGYDHMEAEEAAVMEKKQEEILDRLHITRDES
ncbi:rRNA maturation RNase YbeY [Kineothrix sp. MB12-C1]|uniref:rRNA maturation RNase YbeY n=1 Tax=Kineothrix sp. MB12-C1 TaxID=3070215 RepID=UPI0027D2EAF7|nr:rRNA maturation RNase YbeY [Kineothrix sp. MB12-C1]WMC92481.1 rRNA maturation RNase YbeY [Kineothrix sp. MB12-C1]